MSDSSEGTLHCVWIHLAPNEWGNEIMRQAAAEYVAAHPELRPLLVHVHEHAGWSRGWNEDMVCVSSANDAAKYPAEVHAWWARVNGLPRSYVTSIRRENATCATCGGTEHIEAPDECYRCRMARLAG